MHIKGLSYCDLKKTKQQTAGLGRDQLLRSALMNPQMTTYNTTRRFTPVKMLLNLEDSFTPKVSIPAS